MNRPPRDGAKPRLRRKGLLRAGRLLALLLFLFGSILLYLSQVGVPGFARIQIENALHARGMDFDIDRLRLRGLRTWVAENVRLRMTDHAPRPDITIPQAELDLSWDALRQFKLEPQTFRVRRGHLTIPIVYSNLPPAQLPLEDINLELRFLPDARWHLAHFAARCLNAGVQASGTLTNASLLRSRKPSEPGGQSDSGWPLRWYQLAIELHRVSLDAASTLRLQFQGDGLEPSTLRATLEFQAPRATTPWAEFEKVRLGVDVSPGPASSQSINAKVDLEVGRVQTKTSQFSRALFSGQFTGPITNWSRSSGNWRCELQSPQIPWGSAESVSISGTAKPPADGANDSSLELAVEAKAVRTPWGDAQSASLASDLRRPSSSLGSLNGSWNLGLKKLESRWGNSEAAQFSGHLRRIPGGSGRRDADARWGWWQRLEPVQLDWEGQISRVSSPTLQVDQVELAGEWRAPELAVRKFQAQLYEGQLALSAGINMPSREVQAKLSFDFDVHHVAPLLTTNTQRWLQQFSWQSPPQVTAEGRIILPAWTNRQPNRFREAARTSSLSGAFQAGPGAFRGVTVTSARSHFTLNDSVWRLPDLIVQRPEGLAHLDGLENTATREYSWTVRSAIDPKGLMPLLEPAQRRVLDFFEFAQTPWVQGQIRGQWRKPDLVGVSAEVAVTNLTFRGEAFDEFRAAIQYTNRFVTFGDVEVQRGSQRVTASKGSYDPRAGVVQLTNGVSTMEPDLVARVISSPVRSAISPYHFKEPPTVIVNGRLPTVSEASAEAEFKITGKAFNYWRFNVPEVSADVRWRGDAVTISNLQASFYKGRLQWDGQFDFASEKPTRYQFRGQVAKSDLQSLVSDLTLTNTSLEGILDGKLAITSADTSAWQTWQGFGEAQLHDGSLGSVPVFGVFSPILNNLVPGIGPSRISAATATFEIDQGRIKTGDLEMRAPALRLQYVGNVDFKGHVDARVQAEILRDALGAVGRAVSVALWPVTKVFESKITGTLNEPKSEFLYFPKFLLWPLRPLRTIREVILPDRTGPVQPSPKKTEPAKPIDQPPGD